MHENWINCLLACKDCNSKKGNIPFGKWLKLHPEIIGNIQKHIDQVVELINTGKIIGYDEYPEAVAKTLKEASRGKINLDVPALNTRKYTAKTA